MNSIKTANRIHTLDYLRGFALLGILLVNILPLLSVQITVSLTADASYWKFLYLFVEGRFYTIFSFLFGVSFYLFITRANSRRKNSTVLFLRRILVMFLMGLIHFSFQPGEALTVYAVCGLLVLPFYKVKKETNLMVGLTLLIGLSVLAIKPLLPIPLILLGLTAGQYQLFEDLASKKKQVAFFTGMMGVLSVIGLVYQYQQASFENYTFYHIGIMIGPAVSAFYVGMLILLLNIPVIQRILTPLKAYGRMALTNYLLQTALILIIGAMLDVFGQITYMETLYVCAVIYGIQLAFSSLWLRYFQFGPFEWIWRGLTYLEMPPLVKKETRKDAK
ncbi:DUF418 domain-containing protein [Mesobacillus foraminis]|uniref:Putative membrane protein YeiB n=1 Tax=Mesobacillus foraminis TaxID=279826 RepID=A0A4R2BID8_9BACI|nr:DUF418 domain-containing protein [Mesobacillus foraminis]TCN26841.1 putative membrane protein YeiB [Mesobacillus foraminis]